MKKREPAQKMARFYRMAVMPNLFGEWTLYREWGRIGQGGQVRMDWFEDENQAVAALVTTGSLQASARLLDGASAARDVQMIA
ncbi:WGR domain-containing protein [Pseudosulfitobacter pseudonitzschiae]|uniref:WGR domain-containing protein n=1 Tax=Pseudosulfitobacter pseudonitzschiae TaxID=1402135 RepID=UPI001FD14A6F|nr:WGR domain-containing protein [Pseudosulfitobacter pseudonitzschiae]